MGAMDVQLVEIVAELGSVHDGSLGNASRLIDAAADSGATAVKFQIHLAEYETSPTAPSPAHFSSESRYEYFKRIQFDQSQWRQLRDHSHERGLNFVASPFSLEALEIALTIGADVIKIASGEVTNLPLLEAIGESGKPAYLSSGMSNWDELDKAVELTSENPLTLLQCTSLYPCPDHRVGLNVIPELSARYGTPVGLSDHSQGAAAALGAVMLGATVIEKHLTFSRLMYGSDAPFASTPEEFAALASEIARLIAILGNPVDKNNIHAFEQNRRVYMNSVVAGRTLNEGHILSKEDLRTRKPGTGIPSIHLPELIGRVLKRPVEEHHQLDWQSLR